MYVYADGADDAEHVMTIATVTAITILTALSRMSVRGVLYGTYVLVPVRFCHRTVFRFFFCSLVHFE